MNKKKLEEVIKKVKILAGRINTLSNKIGKEASYENSREANLIFKELISLEEELKMFASEGGSEE